MNNAIILKNLQNNFNSLRYFQIINNELILNYQGYYKIPLNFILLSDINPQIFILNPIEIFQIIYTLELLFKKSLNNEEQTFIINFTNKYLSLNESLVTNQIEDENLVWCLSIPIYSAYDEKFTNNPASQIIQKVINDFSITNTTNQKGPKLVLTNSLFIQEEVDDPLVNLEKAGFTVSLLIISTVIITSLCITYFILK